MELKWVLSEKQGTRTRYCPKPITNTELKKSISDVNYAILAPILIEEKFVEELVAQSPSAFTSPAPKSKGLYCMMWIELEAKIINILKRNIALCILEMLGFLLDWILTPCWMTLTCRLLISLLHNPCHEDNIAQSLFFLHFTLSQILIDTVFFLQFFLIHLTLWHKAVHITSPEENHQWGGNGILLLRDQLNKER